MLLTLVLPMAAALPVPSVPARLMGVVVRMYIPALMKIFPPDVNAAIASLITMVAAVPE
jgi:hypothetical protein